MKIIKATMRNTGIIEALEIDAQGNHVDVSGDNETGKTTTANHLAGLLMGKDAGPGEPIRKNQDKSVVHVEFGGDGVELTIDKTTTKSGARLKITDKEGNKLPPTQATITALLGKRTVRPMEFLGLPDKEQIAQVLDILGIEPPVDAVKAIAGNQAVPHAQENAADYIKRVELVLMDERKKAGAIKSEREARKKTEEDRLAVLGGPVGDDKIEDTTKTVAEIESLEKKQEDTVKVLENIAALNDERQALDEREKRQEEEQARISQQIERLQDQITELDTLKKAAKERTNDTRAHIVANKQRIEQAEEQRKEMPDLEDEIAYKRDAFSAMSVSNTKIIARATQEGLLLRENASVREAVKVWEGLDSGVKQIRALGSNLLDGADMGIEGLEIASGELRLNGHSLRGDSTSEGVRVKTAFALMSKQSPKIRVALFDRASDLGRKLREEIIKTANERGYQVIFFSTVSDKALTVDIIEK